MAADGEEGQNIESKMCVPIDFCEYLHVSADHLSTYAFFYSSPTHTPLLPSLLFDRHNLSLNHFMKRVYEEQEEEEELE